MIVIFYYGHGPRDAVLLFCSLLQCELEGELGRLPTLLIFSGQGKLIQKLVFKIRKLALGDSVHNQNHPA